METKRTPKQWVAYLSDEQNPRTLMEFMAGCLARILGAQIETAQAAGHTEGMIGRLEKFVSRSNPGYAMSDAELFLLEVEQANARKSEGRPPSLNGADHG